MSRHCKHICMVGLLAIFVAGEATGSTTFSEMNAEEVSTLLAKGETASTGAAVSAKDAVGNTPQQPVTLTARDMVSKVYGIIDPQVCKDECLSQTQQSMRLTPIEDENALWLETEGGFGVDYYGMSPEVSAMARFADDDSGASDFGFFFLFPYTAATHDDCIKQQADFCGTLLQEMADGGMSMALNIATDDLFEAIGDYNGNQIDVRLLDDQSQPGEGCGRYILILAIEPSVH